MNTYIDLLPIEIVIINYLTNSLYKIIVFIQIF